MPTESRTTRILSRHEVAGLLDLSDCIAAVEEGFRALAEGRAIPPATIGAHVQGGAFHIKAAGLLGDAPVYAAKVNGNFYANDARGLPRIQGLIVLCDAVDGFPLAVMDSIHITGLRTAAATGVAARHLARADSTRATIVGCGVQGRTQLAALRCLLPISQVWVADLHHPAAEQLAGELAGELAATAVPLARIGEVVAQSDVIVTCTPSNQPLLHPGDLSAGAFVAAVGADSEEKQELDAGILGTARVVVDHLEQCATIGELHHALEAGTLGRDQVHAELAQVVAGQRPGRTDSEQVFVFDSTGVALQDVAAAALAYRRAVDENVGRSIDILG